MAPRGHIRQRDNGSWEVIVPAGRDRKTGRYRYVSRSLRAPATRRDAMDLRDELLAQAEEEVHRVAKGTVAELLEDWMATYGEDWSPTTRRHYRQVCDNYLIPKIGQRQLRRLTTQQINTAYRELRANGGRRKTKEGKATGLGQASVARIHGMLHSALAYAQRSGMIVKNPADGAYPGRGTPERRACPTPAEAQALIAAGFGISEEYGTFLVLSAALSRRCGEICGLRRRDVDLAKGEVSVMGTVVEDGGGVVYRNVTKTRQDSTLALDPQSLAILKRHMLAMEKRALGYGVRLGRDAFIFSEQIDCSKPWWPHTQSHRFRKIRDKLGYDHLVLHGMRHFGITYMLAGGVDLRTTQSRVGHRSMQVTERYSHFVTDADRAAAATLGALIHGPAEERSG